MRIPINLASQPQRRDRPMLIASAAVALLLTGLLGALVSLNMMERDEQAETRAGIAVLQREAGTLNSEQAKLEAVLRQPENAEVLERSVFLNALLQRKGISWTRIFADLEKTLPHNVRLISIRPVLTGQGQVLLDMTVGSESPDPAIAMLRSLESSLLFGSAQLHSSLPPSQTEPLYRYRVTVNYAQRL